MSLLSRNNWAVQIAITDATLNCYRAHESLICTGRQCLRQIPRGCSTNSELQGRILVIFGYLVIFRQCLFILQQCALQHLDRTRCDRVTDDKFSYNIYDEETARLSCNGVETSIHLPASGNLTFFCLPAI